jgi:hypothetical protein
MPHAGSKPWKVRQCGVVLYSSKNSLPLDKSK